MAVYLRDQQISNVSMEAESLRQLSNVFAERLSQLHAEPKPDSQSKKQSFFTYVIRFDHKGYRVFSFDELMRYFNQANEVERIVFTLESGDAIATNRQVGAFLELYLDAKDPLRCVLVSSSDNKDWAEASFSAVYEVLAKCKTKNAFVRTPWMNFAVQLLGVIVIFVLSLWTAFKISPYLKVENPFVISFLFILLIFSNIWTYLNPTILGLIAKPFPNIDFIRPERARLHWLLQAVVGSAVFAIVIFVLGAGLKFLLQIVTGFFAPSA